jgi:hypothetical protein
MKFVSEAVCPITLGCNASTPYAKFDDRQRRPERLRAIFPEIRTSQADICSQLSRAFQFPFSVVTMLEGDVIVKIKELTPAPTSDVPWITGRDLDVAAATVLPIGSPALSTNVLRCLASGSVSVRPKLVAYSNSFPTTTYKFPICV